MKLNKRIRSMLKEANHWHCLEAFEKQGVKCDDITIYKTGTNLNHVGTYNISYRTYNPKREGEWGSQQYWEGEFGVRDSSGNLTWIGRKMGIKTRDKKISIYTPRGQAIDNFLHKMAYIDASRLTNDRSQIKDRTRYLPPEEMPLAA